MKILISLFFLLPILSFSQIENKTYDVIVLQARFPNGIDSLQTFFKNNTNKITPKTKNIGVVVYQFTVLQSGKIKNITLTQGLNKKVNKEYLRVIELMPKWEPCEFAAKYVIENIQLTIQTHVNKKTNSTVLEITTKHINYQK